tara:strand:- start:375 stop:563 length:189 start_codon:yes stop_codon:yes gene_type:complete
LQHGIEHFASCNIIAQMFALLHSCFYAEMKKADALRPKKPSAGLIKNSVFSQCVKIHDYLTF